MKKYNIILNPSFNYLKNFIEDIPCLFDKEGEIIYQGRNLLKTYYIKETDLVVKRFKKPFLINQIVYTFFRKSKARRSYEYAFELLKRDCPTPLPVAFIEIIKGGLLKRSFFISLYETNAHHVREYMNGKIRNEKVLMALAEFTAKIHKQEIYHIDFSPGNILMSSPQKDKYRFSLIDINRLKFKKLSFKERCKNFNRLCISPEVSSTLGKYYADYAGLAPKATVYEINKYSDRFFLQKCYHLTRKYIRKKEGIVKSFIGPLQKYLLYRGIRTIFFKGKKNTSIYNTEVFLYKKYLAREDNRDVLKKRYGYI